MNKTLLSVLIIFLLSITTLTTIVTANGVNNSNILQNHIKNIESDIGQNFKGLDNGSVTIYNEGCCEGYTLLGSMNNYVKLIDMNGNVIRNWSMCGFPAKMLPGGSLMAGDKYSYPDAVTTLTQVGWDGVIEWSFGNWKNNRSEQTHDFQREGNPIGYYAPGQDFKPNGTTLILAHDSVYNKSISFRKLLDCVIYEVDWNGNLTGFEWYASEHFNQMGFTNRAKHGIYFRPGGSFIQSGGLLPKISLWSLSDWIHINSMSLLGENHWYDEDPEKYSYFNPDNIIITSRQANFIAIISRETGDIVWRIGPNFETNFPKSNDKLSQIIAPHHAHMIPMGLPGEGNILLFDNGGAAGYGYFGGPNKFRGYSKVIEFNPITEEIIWEYSNIKKGHSSFFWMFSRFVDREHFFSPYQSSAQRLPNGNTLITESNNGIVFEITPDKEIVWEYLVNKDICDNTIVSRKDIEDISIYRAYRVPPEWIPENPADYTFWE